MAYDIDRELIYSNPIEIFGSDYATVQSFFQYQFPPRRLSAQSWGLQENLTDTQKDELYSKMLKAVTMLDSDIFYSSCFWLPNNPDIQTIQRMGLADSTFICDKRKGFSQITNATKYRPEEHKLTALSRRLRDSFGHARIGAYGDYVLFEDKAEKNITGRIVLKKEDLITWKETIEQYIAGNGVSVS